MVRRGLLILLAYSIYCAISDLGKKGCAGRAPIFPFLARPGPADIGDMLFLAVRLGRRIHLPLPVTLANHYRSRMDAYRPAKDANYCVFFYGDAGDVSSSKLYKYPAYRPCQNDFITVRSLDAPFSRNVCISRGQHYRSRFYPTSGRRRLQRPPVYSSADNYGTPSRVLV